jgi:hypothetical protein
MGVRDGFPTFAIRFLLLAVDDEPVFFVGFAM